MPGEPLELDPGRDSSQQKTQPARAMPVGIREEGME